MNSEEPSKDLTVVDLQNLRSVIDIAARRGAFGAAEMTAVGTVYTKLDAFLNAIEPEQPPEEKTLPDASEVA
jgi:hypothetical protein